MEYNYKISSTVMGLSEKGFRVLSRPEAVNGHREDAFLLDQTSKFTFEKEQERRTYLIHQATSVHICPHICPQVLIVVSGPEWILLAL